MWMYDELRRSKEEYVRGLIRTEIPLVGRGSIDESEAIRWFLTFSGGRVILETFVAFDEPR